MFNNSKLYFQFVSITFLSFWTIISFTLAGCGSAPTTGAPPTAPTGYVNATSGSFYANVSQELGIHYVNFLNQGYNHGMDLSLISIEMQFDESLTASKAGACVPATSTSAAKVSINPSRWQTLTDNNKENLIFHELGLCILHRVNRYDLNNGIPLSIMFSSLISTAAYRANYSQYLYELFRQSDLPQSLPLKSN